MKALPDSFWSFSGRQFAEHFGRDDDFVEQGRHRGCFDMLHSGHVVFLQSAPEYGDLCVALGSDKTVYELKGRAPVNSEEERLYVVQSVGCVKSAFVARGSGILDFTQELESPPTRRLRSTALERILRVLFWDEEGPCRRIRSRGRSFLHTGHF